jgi:tetratricopeptide (TPR) repeat protein
VPTSGKLWEGVLPGVLRELYVGRKTGVLSFSRNDERRNLHVRGGHIVNADTSVREDRMGEVMVREGLLSPADLKRARGFALRDKRRLGEVLIDLGLLDARGLEEALEMHVHAVLAAVFSWSDGTYEFREEPEIAGELGDVALRASTGDLILEATRSVKDPDVVRYNLGDVDRVLGLSSDPLLRFQRIALTPTDGYLLSRIDGHLSAREVMQLIPLPTEEAQRSLFGLLSTGVVEYLEDLPRRQAAEPVLGRGGRKPAAAATPLVTAPASAGSEATPEDAQPAAPSSPAAPPLPPAVAPSAPMGADPVPPPPPPPPEPSSMDIRRSEILEAYEGLRTRTHYQVLEIERDASEAQVKEAYFRMAKRFHPDVHHDLALHDLRDKLEAVFIRLGEAYEVLRNARLRASYERQLGPAQAGGALANVAPAGDDRASMVRSAEESILRAGRSVAEEKYWEAIQLLEASITRVDGRIKQVGRILLARAYSKNPNWVKPAEQLLQQVIHEDPHNVDAYFQLAGIYRAGGLRSRAATMLRRALELEPDHQEARSQLAALDAESHSAPSEPGGLLKKLLRRK